MVIIKGKVLLLIGILVTAGVTVTAYQVTSTNPQISQSNIPNLQAQANTDDQDNSQISDNSLQSKPHSSNDEKTNSKKYSSSKSYTKTSDSQSIAQKYIEEPGAVAGTPENYDIGGKNTDVVPVIQDGKRVGEIDIDPKTGKNVGGAGGAPS